MKQTIEQLLEKYYEGETTLAEEKHLRAFFQQADVPAHLQAHAAPFRYSTQARREHPSVDVTDRLTSKLRLTYRPVWVPASQWAVAASVLLLLVGFAGGYLLARWPPNASPSAGVDALDQSASVGAIRDALTFEGTLQTSASERIQAVNQSAQLDRIDQAITQLLINTLNFDANVNVRLAACQALLRFEREPGVREALIQSLSIQTDPNVQISLIDALVTMKERRAVRPMQRLVRNQQVLEVVRWKAQESLQQLTRLPPRPS